MSLEGEDPLTREIRAQLGGEKRAKPISNQLQMAKTLQDPSRGPMKAIDQRWGHSGLVGVRLRVSGPYLVGHLVPPL
jgi:hypothetical protein